MTGSEQCGHALIAAAARERWRERERECQVYREREIENNERDKENRKKLRGLASRKRCDFEIAKTLRFLLIADKTKRCDFF